MPRPYEAEPTVELEMDAERNVRAAIELLKEALEEVQSGHRSERVAKRIGRGIREAERAALRIRELAARKEKAA